MRLAAFYDARADAFLLAQRGPDKEEVDYDLFIELAQTLSPPPSIDFGRLAHSPLDELISPLKKALSKYGGSPPDA
jgi:hypothetical protein